jgi:hypothetical protein
MRASRVGDVDEDGYDDVALGLDLTAVDHDLRVVQGPFSAGTELDLSKEAERTFTSTVGGPNTWLAYATPLGDWSDDGHGAIAIADPWFATDEALSRRSCENFVGCAQGAVFIMGTPIDPGVHDLGTDADRIEGAHDQEDFGGGNNGPALQGGVDLNADGHPDLVVGAPGVNVGASRGGAAYILFGPS